MSVTALLPSVRPESEVGADVAKAVRAYCHRIGCDASSTEGAIRFAQRASNDLFTAVQFGKRRAAQLRARAAAGEQVPA